MESLAKVTNIKLKITNVLGCDPSAANGVDTPGMEDCYRLHERMAKYVRGVR